MNVTKCFWVVRAILYKFRFGQIKFPSYLGKPTYISAPKQMFLGGVRIYPGLRAELVGKNARITIGNNVSIGQNFHVVSYEDDFSIGNNVTISGNVFISNCDHSYQEIGVHILDQNLIENKTIIGDGCYIGYGAVILAGTVLGKQCIVGANSVVRGEFPDYSVIAGAPARIVKKYNKEKNIWERTEAK